MTIKIVKRLIYTNETDNTTLHRHYTLAIRMQLLWMDFSVASAYFRRYVLPLFQAELSSQSDDELLPQLRLKRITILRENYHSRCVTYEVCEKLRNTNVECHDNRDHDRMSYCLEHCRVYYCAADANDPVSNKERIRMLREAVNSTTVDLLERKRNDATIIEPTTCFDFWKPTSWWIGRVPDFWFQRTLLRRNARRTTHLLNQLTRILRQLYRQDLATALQTIRRLTEQQAALIDATFIEPINGSLLPSHLSTIFMHNKQQTGLNMKHEANKLSQIKSRTLQSDRPFNPKIYLKMCTSCVRRDIFEIMLRVKLSVHNGIVYPSRDRSHDTSGDLGNNRDQANASDSNDNVSSGTVDDGSGKTNNNNNDTEKLLCHCVYCDRLRIMANAWRYYNCNDYVWIRLEFSRKICQQVCETINAMIHNREIVDNTNVSTTDESHSTSADNVYIVSDTTDVYSRARNLDQKCFIKINKVYDVGAAAAAAAAANSSNIVSEPDVQLIFTSDKNEFYDKNLFIQNFVNYYTFYENGEHPLTVSQSYGKMRNIVSMLYVFATMNWVMITDSRKLSLNNSISMNQQSLCKSRKNPVFAAFSENCINRVRAENVRHTINDNAAYINRGLGIVPNTGINAFNIAHTKYF